MPSFSYSAVASNGRNAAGVIDAPDKPGAIARLAERGEFVTEIAPAADERRAGPHRARTPRRRRPAAPAAYGRASG